MGRRSLALVFNPHLGLYTNQSINILAVRCKTCKEKFEQYEFNNKYCKEIDCQTAKALFKLDKIKKAQAKASRKETREAKEKLKTKSDYEKELERIFNAFIRERDKRCDCISCGSKAGTYKITAGHYFPAGSYKNIRFDEDNVHGQCWFNCNKNRHGNLQEYRIGLIQRIGKDRLENLDTKRLEPSNYSIPDLKEMKIIYRDKIKALKLQ